MLNAMSTRRLFRINLWLHRWSSLIATPFFLILCITGTVLIFHHEIDEALGYVPTASVHAESTLPLSASVAAAQAANPDQRILLVGQDEEEHPGLIAVYMAPKVDTGFERSKPV